jgi:glycine hydroxymethyltransferase
MILPYSLQDSLQVVDAELAELIRLEDDLQRRSMPLNASENIVSPAVREACGSIFINRVAEGYLGSRCHSHC